MRYIRHFKNVEQVNSALFRSPTLFNVEDLSRDYLIKSSSSEKFKIELSSSGEIISDKRVIVSLDDIITMTVIKGGAYDSSVNTLYLDGVNLSLGENKIIIS